jgi:hypothetical protein
MVFPETQMAPQKQYSDMTVRCLQRDWKERYQGHDPDGKL